MARHTEDELEVFAQELAINGDDASKAYVKAKPNSKAKPESVHALACRMAAREDVIERVKYLKSQARVQAETRFSITVEQRLRWLEEIAKAGMQTYSDGNGAARRENLAAARAAIATINDMLGTSESDKKDRKSFNVVLRVEDASSPE